MSTTISKGKHISQISVEVVWLRRGQVKQIYAAGQRGNTINRWQKRKQKSVGQESEGQTTG